MAVRKKKRKGLRISQAIRFGAKRKPRKPGDGANIHPFVLASHPPSVFPEGIRGKGLPMAMDDAITSSLAWAEKQIFDSPFKEGLRFLGYAYLSELAQRGEYRAIVETLSTEMTRKWCKVIATGDEEDKSDKITEINAEFDRLKVQDRFRKYSELDGFFGRSHLFLDFGDRNDRPELLTPVGNGRNDLSLVKFKDKNKRLERLQVVEPVWCYPSAYNTNDPLAPDWYKPERWFCLGKEIHSSRMLTLIGREVPDLLKPAYSFGGLSLSQMAKPYVDNWLKTRQSVNDTISAFSVFVLMTELGDLLQNSEEVFKRADFFNDMRDNRGLMMIDKDSEDFKNVSTSLATLDVLQAQSQEHMAAISHIPLVKLTGIQPQGLNADSEGVMRCFYDWIKASQEAQFNEPLLRILGFVQLGLYGEVDPEISFKWVELNELTEKERSEKNKTDADRDNSYIESGVLDPIEVRQRLANDEDSPYSGIDADDLPTPSQEEEPGGGPGEENDEEEAAHDSIIPFGLDWNEGDHPRDRIGQFARSGSGGGVKSHKERVFTGKPKKTKNNISKQTAGKIGENMVVKILRSAGMKDARPLNMKSANFPVDLIEDHRLIEVKTGLVSNSEKAQQWRATIGQPGPKEASWLKKASDEDKRAWNDKKRKAILQRKAKVLKEFSKKMGKPMKAMTVALVYDPDTGKADVHVMDGFHPRIGWRDAAKDYVGTFSARS